MVTDDIPDFTWEHAGHVQPAPTHAGHVQPAPVHAGHVQPAPIYGMKWSIKPPLALTRSTQE